MRPVKPGDPINQHLTARTYNRLIRRQERSTYIPSQRDVPNPCYVRVQGAAPGREKGIYEPVGIDYLATMSGPTDTVPDDLRHPFYGQPAFKIKGLGILGSNFVILQDYLNVGSSARAVAVGLTWAKVYYDPVLYGGGFSEGGNSTGWVGVEKNPNGSIAEANTEHLVFKGGPSIAKVVYVPKLVPNEYNYVIINMQSKPPSRIVGQAGFGGVPAAEEDSPGIGFVTLQYFNRDTLKLQPTVPGSSATQTTKIQVMNVHEFVVPANAYVTCSYNEAFDFYVIDHPSIVDLRVNGFALQYKMSHGDWVTWHVGAACDETNPSGSQFFRTGTTDSYLRPDGTSTYIRA